MRGIGGIVLGAGIGALAMAASRQVSNMIRSRGSSGPAQASGSGAMIWPISGPVTSEFGWRTHPIFGTARFHSGLDIGGDYGMLGGVLQYAGVPRPVELDGVAQIFIHMGAWTGLIPVGYSIDFPRIRKYWLSLFDLSFIKFVAAPAIIYLLSHLVISNPDMLGSLLVLACMGQDQDDVVIVPLTTAQERLLGITYVKSINIQVSDSTKMDQVQSEVETLLRQRHHIIGDKEDDFSVRNLTSLMTPWMKSVQHTARKPPARV